MQTERPFLLGIAMALSAAIAACGGSTTKPTAIPQAAATPSESAEVGEGHDVEYRLSGSAKYADVVYVTYSDVQGESKRERVKLPWSERFGARDQELLYVSGQEAGGKTPLRCEITIDGERAKKNEGPGLVSCDAVPGGE